MLPCLPLAYSPCNKLTTLPSTGSSLLPTAASAIWGRSAGGTLYSARVECSPRLSISLFIVHPLIRQDRDHSWHLPLDQCRKASDITFQSPRRRFAQVEQRLSERLFIFLRRNFCLERNNRRQREALRRSAVVRKRRPTSRVFKYEPT